jgi:hypothetical protein
MYVQAGAGVGGGWGGGKAAAHAVRIQGPGAGAGPAVRAVLVAPRAAPAPGVFWAPGRWEPGGGL